jgi:hypothetical protein
MAARAKERPMALRREHELHPERVHWPETTCLELADDILSEAVARLQAARKTT